MSRDDRFVLAVGCLQFGGLFSAALARGELPPTVAVAACLIALAVASALLDLVARVKRRELRERYQAEVRHAGRGESPR